MADLPGEGQISPRQNGQQVPGEFRGARPGTGQRLYTAEKQHLRIRCRQHGHLQRLTAQTGIGLRKHLSGPGEAHNGAAPPEILLDDMQRPGEDQPQPVRPLSPPQDHFTPATAALPCAQALQQRRQRLLRNPAEQRRPEKKRGRNFHTIFSIPL